MSRVTEIYFYPDEMSAASNREVADYIGVSCQTINDRMKTLGPDHYLTYFPGPIPGKLRRFQKCKVMGSTLSLIKRERKIELLDPILAKTLVFRLIKTSQKYWKDHRCQESKSFLLNENGMLEWYMEAYPGIDQTAFLERMRKWVKDN